MDCTPQGLVTTAQPLQAIPDGYQLSQLTSLFAQWAGVSVDANSLANAASSLQSLDGIGPDVLIALLAKISGGSVDANVIAKAASCGFCGIPTGYQMIVMNSIMCHILDGGNINIGLPNDPDAANFVCGWLNICAAQTGACTTQNNCPPGTVVPISATCASFCGINQTTVNALETLVTSLKSAGLWTLMDVIYPFVGGNSGACSLNLKDTTKFAITWHGGVIFSASGVTGDGATGYGDTGFNPSTAGGNFSLNSGAMGAYINGTNQANLMGGFSIVAVGSTITNSVIGLIANVNGDNAGTTPNIPYSPPTSGNYIVSRTAANLTNLYAPFGGPTTTAAVPAGLTAFSLYVLSAQFSGVPNTFNSATMKMAWAGAGLTAGQVTSLSTIITTFETALGRA